ncbi:MAG: sigma-70 family RNA polymerase sigma factor [Lachnospiraceae bacterium]|jgi:RNA polymerase sigma factor (sigma-70 family)|nr:sigma-70 family RNA polymerase sigma factor [Lachnospiraceae bacterium]
MKELTGQEIEETNRYFEAVYCKTNRGVTLYLISKCKNFSDVNDILQEVYLEFYQVLLKKGKAYFKNEESFLISLCRKKMAKYYSFWDRIPHKVYIDEKEIYEQEELLTSIDFQEDIEEVFYKTEMVTKVQELLKKKSDEIQKIFYLYYTMELRIPEIAKLLQMKPQTVKSKLYRTRNDLYKELKRNK